jgi:hypothetical protein
MKRSRFTKEQIIGMREQEAGVPVADLCRKHGLRSPTIYKWKARYGGMDAIKFPDLIHAVKMEADKGYLQAASVHDTFWDFIGLMPEVNFHQIPINQAKGCPFQNFQGDGHMQMAVPKGRANYEPNSLAEAGEDGGPREDPKGGVAAYSRATMSTSRDPDRYPVRVGSAGRSARGPGGRRECLSHKTSRLRHAQGDARRVSSAASGDCSGGIRVASQRLIHLFFSGSVPSAGSGVSSAG